MKNTLVGLMALVLVGLLSIVPWTEAGPKPESVLIWCQDSTGAQAPCVGGNQLDYDTTGSTSNVGVVGIVIPSSSGPVAGGTTTNPFVVSVNNATLAVTQSGTWTLAANQSVNVAQINGVTPLMGAGNTGTGSARVTEATDSQLSAGVGATGDAAATAGGTGSINAKLRLLTDLTNQVLTELGQKTEPSNTQAISAASLPLPTGAATAANQDGIIKDGTGDTTQANVSGGNVHVAIQTAIPAGTNNIGDVDVLTLPALPTGTNTIGNVGVLPVASGGTSVCYITSAASLNATNCKSSAGQLYGYDLVNTTTTIYYLRLYNMSVVPTCSASTGFVRTIPIPPAAAAGGAGGVARSLAVGEAYGTGLGFCLTGGGSSTDNTNAATGVYVSLNYK